MKCELYNDSMEWKDIKGYEGLYQVSNTGLVRSVSHQARNNINGGIRQTKGKILSPYKMPNGYLQVQLCKNNKRTKHYIHRLVADAYIDNFNRLSEVNHLDGNKDNNGIENLEWISHKNNQIHMVKNHLTRRAKPVICVKTGKIYCSLCEAERITGIDRHKIKIACDKGNEWRYINGKD